MTPPCEQVTERLALGEPLGELAEHAATCEHCRGVAAISSKLGTSHHAVDPGPGFSARMTAGAQHLITVRRRRRLVAGLAATVASGAFGVFLVTRVPDDVAPPRPAAAIDRGSDPAPPDEGAKFGSDSDLAALVQMSDVDRSTHLSARWDHIKRPLAPYKKLLKGGTP